MTKRKVPSQRKDITHGHAGQSRSREYNSWAKMMDRCTNANSDSYSNYGGRGIAVCKEWLKFENFYADMGNRPENTSLDRIDPDGHYCKDNCRWASRTTQARNRRKSSNKFGCPGVSIDSRSGAFVAKVHADGKAIPLYYGFNLDDAIAARLHWEKANGY